MAQNLKASIENIQPCKGVKAIRLDMWDNVTITLAPHVARIQTAPVCATVFYDYIVDEGDGRLALVEGTGKCAGMRIATIDCAQIDDITHECWEED